jgi:hypothetical protein
MCLIMSEIAAGFNGNSYNEIDTAAWEQHKRN